MIALWLAAPSLAADDPPPDDGASASDDSGDADDADKGGSWLDAARPEDSDASDPSDTAPGRAEDGSFGTQLDVLGLQVSWSGYGDISLYWRPVDRQFTFQLERFNPILGVRLSNRLWAETEIEFEDAGTEVGLEYAVLDWSPKPWLGLRMGKFLVPMGDFNEVLHPSFRWPQISRPAMFTDVVPSEWSEVGIEARGTVPTGASGAGRYAVYVCNGLGSTFDPTSPSPIRDARDNAEDLNGDVAVGGQLGYEVRPGDLGTTSVDAALYTGAIDLEARTRVTIADVAVSSQLGPVVLRGEAARSFLGPSDDPLRAFEDGLYGQVAVTVGRVTPSVRYDVLREASLVASSSGVSSSGSDPTLINQGTATVLVKLATFWSLRGEGLVQWNQGGWDPTIALQSSFFF